MDLATKRPAITRRPATLLMLALSVFVVASLASATSAFAHDTQICISLNPPTADNQLPEQSSHTVTATVTKTTQFSGSMDPNVYCNDPQVTKVPAGAGLTVYFNVLSGPNVGAQGTGVTDANSQATFTWSSSVSGTDTVEAYTAMEYDDETGLPTYDPAHQAFGDIAWDSAVKNWLPPVTPPEVPTVAPSGLPDTTMAVSKKCQSKKFSISASSSGTVSKYVLQIDGKTVATSKGSTGTKKFTVNSGKYSPGTHSIKLTTTFTNGSKVVKTGKFKRCAIRTTARRINPNFTG
jgi:hypothetical protein